MLAQTGVADVILDDRGLVVKKRRYPDTSGWFLARAEAVARITHPNVVAVIESGLDGELPYYVMEYVAGDTLADRVVPDVGIEIARGLVALHGAGVTHGALSPEHVFVEPVKIGGFDSGQGPPWYMAPEQWDEDAQLTAAIDVYALGCILFEIGTGNPPFEADSANRLRELHTAAKPPVLDEPHGALVAEMLAKRAADRPTAREVEAALIAATGATATRR